MMLGAQPSPSFPYRIEARVGEGAMGEVYRATEVALDRPVAIKVLRPDFLARLTPDRAAEAKRRFMQEARAAAALSHPGITVIYRVGEHQDMPFIAMEWLAGQSLEQLLAERGRLPADQVIRLGIDLLETLAHAHEHGVIHRDIKPGNLVLLSDGRLKIADFGVARIAGSRLVQTQAGSILGTPHYAPPEQVRGQDVDARADIYSTGVVLYEAVTGKRPYQVDDIIVLVENIVSEREPPAAEELDPHVPSSLSTIIQTAMSKRRSMRFTVATQMAAALRSLVSTSSSESEASAEERSARRSLGSLSRPITARPTADQLQAPTAVLEGDTAVALVTGLIERWPSTALGHQAVATVIQRLADRPLHAPAFAGAALIGQAMLLCHDGMIHAVLDPRTGAVTDAVFEELPEAATVVLYPVPAGLPDRVVVALASLLHPPHIRHDDLDSSFVDLVQLVGKLMREGFDGVLRFALDDQLALLLFDQGTPLLQLFSASWPRDPKHHPWPTWVSDHGVTARVDEQRLVLSALTYRRELASCAFAISGHGTERVEIAPEERGDRGQTTMNVIYASAPMFRFLTWMMNELPQFFAERERTRKWKYLAGWVPLVHKAHLYHQLQRPGSNESDFFDLVTLQDENRVLHLVHRVEHGSPAALQDFVDRVLAAKRARIKAGDVGGACLVAPAFDPETVALYQKLTSQEEKRSFFFSLQDSVTGYEGFVRMGTLRGFHLLLIEETENGFRPLLP